MNLLYETIFVGLFFSILASLIHYISMILFKEDAMKHTHLLAQSFVTASLFHILSEYSDLNNYYCSYKKN